MKPVMVYQLIIHMVSGVTLCGGAVVVSCERVLPGPWKFVEA